MKKIRPANAKIPDIKVIRALTRLLGKLHIPSCHRIYTDEGYRQWCQSSGHPIQHEKLYTEIFGWGLKESKDYVELKYSYEGPKAAPPIGYD
jgi:hypothetical protein